MDERTETLFDLGEENSAEDEAPRCRMCPRPARYVRIRDEYSAYCSGSGCPNNRRLCQVCDSEFERNDGEAGTKYCSTECKSVGYRPLRELPACVWCGERARTTPRGKKIWPFVCASCLHPLRYVLQRLRNHRVPLERVRRLLDDPGCEICGLNLLEAIRDTRTGLARAALVVDHDHTCCPSSYSCGRCVRGLLCNNCNSAAGLLRDDPEFAQQLAFYLSRTMSKDDRHGSTV